MITFTETAAPESATPPPISGDDSRQNRVYSRADVTPTARGGSRISIPLDEKGKADLDRLRGETREKLIAALKSPAVRHEVFGEDAGELFSDSDVRQFFQLWFGVEGLLARIILKVPGDIAKKAFTYTEDQFTAITPSTKAILAKYMPSMLAENKDMVVFLGLFSMFTREQFANAVAETRLRVLEQQTKQAEPQRVNGVATDGLGEVQ